MARLRLSEQASADIRDIRSFSKERFGAGLTRTYLTGLRATFGLIRERPFAGRAVDSLLEGLRSFGYRSHRIYYVISDDEIVIARILHHAQDAAARLQET